MGWRSFLYGWYDDLSPAAEEWLLGCALLSFYSLDQTAGDLLAALHPHRSWTKLIRARGRKCPLTSATDHPQAPGEAAGMYENGSDAPRAFSKVGSNMEPSPHHSCNQRPCSAGIGSSFACIGNGSPRRLLIRRRSRPKRLP